MKGKLEMLRRKIFVEKSYEPVAEPRLIQRSRYG